MTRPISSEQIAKIMRDSRAIDSRFQGPARLYDLGAMPLSEARATRATPRAAARLVHAASVAIAVFCTVFFAGQLLRWWLA
jgi:hypothetical protein